MTKMTNVTYRIDKIDATASINLKGWKIVRSDNVSIQPFTTRAEAQRLLDFFGAVPASLSGESEET